MLPIGDEKKVNSFWISPNSNFDSRNECMGIQEDDIVKFRYVCNSAHGSSFDIHYANKILLYII